MVERSKRSAWMVVFTSHVVDLRGDVLYLSFPSERDAESFKKPGPGDTVSELLRRAIVEVLGIRVKFVARVDATAHTSRPAASTGAASQATAPHAANSPPLADTRTSTTSWATVAVPTGDSTTPRPVSAPVATPSAAPDVDPEPLDEADREPEPEFEPEFEPGPDREPEPEFESDDSPMDASPVVAAPLGTAPVIAAPVIAAPKADAPQMITPKPDHDKRRYGESVVREILGASFIEELAVAPRVAPKAD